MGRSLSIILLCSVSSDLSAPWSFQTHWCIDELYSLVVNSAVVDYMDLYFNRANNKPVYRRTQPGSVPRSGFHFLRYLICLFSCHAPGPTNCICWKQSKVIHPFTGQPWVGREALNLVVLTPRCSVKGILHAAGCGKNSTKQTRIDWIRRRFSHSISKNSSGLKLAALQSNGIALCEATSACHRFHLTFNRLL